MACALGAWAATANASGEAIPGSYVVVVKPGDDPKAVASERGAKTKHVYRDAINGFSAQLSDDQVAKLKASKSSTGSTRTPRRT